MDGTVARRPALAARIAFAVWPARGWQAARFVAGGLALQLAAVIVLAVPWLASAFPGGFVPVTATQVTLALVVPLAVLLAALPALTAAQRHRFRAMLGVAIPPPPPAGRRLTRRGLEEYVRSEATWRQLAYHLAAGPALAGGGLLAAGLAAAGLGLTVGLGAAWLLGRPGLVPAIGPFTVLLPVAGVVLLLAVPRLADLVARLDARAGPALLGPSRTRELEQRVETLTGSRSGLVDAADAERRRIERDLHDGAQQRLVSLAMNLGLARETMTDLPEEARAVIIEAHEEAKGALLELRTLVRGLHPAILEDRGLDAALSGIATRAPVPVQLSVDVPQRVSPTVEAIAYFVVSEALANVAKHARASAVEVTVQRRGGRLLVRVTDDGAGGADPARGTGLAGLAQRAASVDGTLSISSPPGGPTTICAELPCAS
jgi:signal transduction histidine kinase